VRKFAQRYYQKVNHKYPHLHDPVSILFVGVAISPAGGTVSIIQEVLAMHRMGVKVAVTFPNTVKKGKAWPIIRGIIPDAEEHTLRQIIILHRPDEIDAIAAKWDVVVATFCLTVDTVSKVHTQYPHILPAYYVQDYEPWFKSSPFDPVKDDDWFRKVGATYTANKPNAVLFAKTQWTAHMVTSIHNVTVHPVTPSLDHDIYYPNRTELLRSCGKHLLGNEHNQRSGHSNQHQELCFES